MKEYDENLAIEFAILKWADEGGGASNKPSDWQSDELGYFVQKLNDEGMLINSVAKPRYVRDHTVLISDNPGTITHQGREYMAKLEKHLSVD